MIEENADIEYTEMIKRVLEEIYKNEKLDQDDKEYMKFDFENLLKKYGENMKDKESLARRILKIIEGKNSNPEFFHMMFNELGDFGSGKFKNLTAGYNEYYNIDGSCKLPISQTFVVMLNEVYGREFMLKSLYGRSLEENVKILAKSRKYKDTLKLFTDIDKFLGEYPTDEEQEKYVPTEESKERIKNIFERLKQGYRKKSPSWNENILCRFCYDRLMGTNTSNFLENNEEIEDIYINSEEFGYVQISGGLEIEVNNGIITKIKKARKQELSEDGR